MRWPSRFTLPLLVACSMPVAAAAQTAAGMVGLDQYQPTPFSDRVLRLDGSGVMPFGQYRVGIDADYALRPLVLSDKTPAIIQVGMPGPDHNVVEHAVGGTLLASFGLGHRLEAGLSVPLTLFQTGETLPGAVDPSTAGVGNVRVGLKGHLLDWRGLGAGAAIVAVVPYGVGTLTHESGFGGEGQLFADYHRGRMTLGARAGYRLRSQIAFYDILLGNELTFAAGATWKLAARTTVMAEVAGVTAAGSPFGNPKQSPLEALLGLRQRVGKTWFSLSGGPGLTDGYGSPVFRVVAGFTWANRPPDADNDGVPDDDDRCPTEPEDRDGFEDADGCPDPDNDKDGIPDVSDKCPLEPETINGIDDDDGCPDKGPSQVRLGKNEIETLRPIYFDTDRSRVRHAFYNILGQIASLLKAHPEIGRCAIEGHTDGTGPPDWNQKLSVLRAEAVIEFLANKGVDSRRLVAIGHGEHLPWASNETPWGRAKNRRVVFHIEGINAEEEKKQELRQERRKRIRHQREREQRSVDKPAASEPPTGEIKPTAKSTTKPTAAPIVAPAPGAPDSKTTAKPAAKSATTPTTPNATPLPSPTSGPTRAAADAKAPNRAAATHPGTKADASPTSRTPTKAAPDGGSGAPPTLRELLKLPPRPGN